MNNKGFDMDRHIYIGYNSYNEYLIEQLKKNGIYDIENFFEILNKKPNDRHEQFKKTQKEIMFKQIKREVEKEIVSNSKKYIDMILNEGYIFTFDDIQRILDIESRNHIQTKIIPSLKTMYITKPCRDFIYAMVYNNKRYFDTFDEEIGASIYYKNRTIPDTKTKIEIYGLTNLEEYGISFKKFRKRLWFTYDDLYKKIDSSFVKEVVLSSNSVKYEKLSDDEIKQIIDKGLKSERTIREYYGLTNLTQLKRRINKPEDDDKKIKIDFKVLMKHEKGLSKAMCRYMIDLPPKETK